MFKEKPKTMVEAIFYMATQGKQPWLDNGGVKP